MLIRCPTCSSAYDLDPGLLADGRILRCAHCRDAWAHRPLPPGAREIRVACRAPDDDGAAADSGPPKRFGGLRPRLSVGAAAALLLATSVGGGMAAVAGKERLVAAFPPSEAVFATLGLPVNLTGLRLDELRSSVVAGDGPATLTLDGSITNLRPWPTTVPPLRIAVRDRGRRELYYWTAPAPKSELAPGETVAFRSRLSAPPRDGQELAVSFAVGAPPMRRLAALDPGER